MNLIIFIKTPYWLIKGLITGRPIAYYKAEVFKLKLITAMLQAMQRMK